MSQNRIPIALSNRHLHISREHLNKLFGENYELTKLKDLKQPGQYAAEEKVDLIGPKGTIKGVRVLGPVRNKTQVEISFADSFVLGVKPPVRDSGDLKDSAGVTIVGPQGEVVLDEGVIAAARHIHMTPDEAMVWGLKDKDVVNVRTGGQRSVVFENVLVRVNAEYALEMHVDLDEGNGAGVKNNDEVELILEQQ
ncbi:phosphate propanoyltransferase [Anoxynatronum buryatiense]|uniref:Phosphate propanoyltransferase n=1 Tax=Anoxynatronum buryatiense TaxID=489973 RepID=A0AA45WUA8_9CLOT|nr:phosphate propanoyltransferase [Anoxynatronum buryatiense]SMP46521.1 putative phosphotransacetylase [Anoxynatronum buryatiense]